MSSLDLEQLKTDLAKLITTTKDSFASDPGNVATQTQLKALLGLETILRTQTLLPQQLEQIRNQIQLSSRPAAPTPTFTPPALAPPLVVPSPQPPALPNFPPALAQLLANTRPPVPPLSSSTPVPAALSLADMLRTVTTPSQPSSAPPTVPPFYPHSFTPVPPPITTPVPAPAPALAPTAPNPVANLAQLLARFNPPAPTPTPPQPPPPLPPFLNQPPVAALTAAPGSAEWLLNALKGFGAGGTSTNPTPVGSEPMTRQVSAPTTQNDIELNTASMKM